MSYIISEYSRVKREDLIPKKIDFKNIRSDRQRKNNELVINAIMKNDMVSFRKHTNEKQVARVLEETKCTLDVLLTECRYPIHAILLAGRISKNASRQGAKDELEQIKVCDNLSQKLGIKIEKLNATDYRPTKSGEIVSKIEMKEKGIRKDNCLKSFDAKIIGDKVSLHGWVFAKVVRGSGGHQDNVFEEADNLCKWISNFRSGTDEIFVILIDTDQHRKFDILKKKYESISNIIVVDHYQFQEYLIRRFSG